MSFLRINWKPTSRDLRVFGGIMLTGFGLLGVFLIWRPGGWGWESGPLAAYVCFAIAGVAGGLGLTGTRAALPFYWAWMGLAFVLSQVTGRAVLIVVFFGLFTPMALLFRVIGRDRLGLRGKETSTYWREAPQPDGKASYERQF